MESRKGLMKFNSPDAKFNKSKSASFGEIVKFSTGLA